jgi:ribosomal protein L37E
MRSDLAQWAELHGYLCFTCPRCFEKFYSDSFIGCPRCGYGEDADDDYPSDNNNKLQAQPKTQSS